MKFSYQACLLFIGAVSAAPQLEARDDPTPEFINLQGAPGVGDTVQCGGKTYNGNSILQSVRYAVALQAAGQTRGAKSYPHAFNNNDSKGVTLTFPGNCPPDTNRQEYPLIQGNTYNGGPNNKNTGKERVVYYLNLEEGEIITENSEVFFCGLITHTGAAVGGFLNC